MTARYVVAEEILAGHPDRLADAVAESIVDEVSASDPASVVGVEVMIHRRSVRVSGYLATAIDAPILVETDSVVRGLADRALVAAGYTGPDRLTLELSMDLVTETLREEQRDANGVSEDQSIVVGHATPDDRCGNLPVEVVATRAARRALARTVAERPEMFGPDGKVMVGIRRGSDRDGPDEGELDLLSVSIQHRRGVTLESIQRAVRPALWEALAEVPGLRVPRSAESVLVVNGAGEFVNGGPLEDGGLSGKKLAVDHYGPGVPLGGGALCGKDLHKADRVGMLRARQVAVRLARASGEAATVWLGWIPGEAEPRVVNARLAGGREIDASGIADLIDLPDLSLRRSVMELELGSVCWTDLLRAGYVGVEQAWDR